MYFDALGGLTLVAKNEVKKIVRVHLRFSHAAESALHTHGRFGLIMVQDDNIADSPDSLPDPIGDSDAAWLINDHFENEVTEGIVNEQVQHDIRAQRLVPRGTTLAFGLEVSSAATASLHWHVAMRILFEHR